jgi:phycocyanobilin:ferredoxin oxidoreductase
LVSAAIVVLSPSSKNQNIRYDKLLSNIDKSVFKSKRDIPGWGDIFSKNVFFASLKNEIEKNAFCKIVDNYLSVLIQLSQKTRPDCDNEIIEERIHYQKNYCVQQMKNEKTSLVLLKYFDKIWVDEYIKKVLFDF